MISTKLARKLGKDSTKNSKLMKTKQENPQSEIQLTRYELLAKKIKDQIISGALKPGDRLPTIRDCAKAENLSPGTVKKAYATLAEDGLIEMTRGRGTIVLLQKKQNLPGKAIDKGSTQSKAMDLIDEMISSMLDLGFTEKEISIYFDLKMKDRAANHNRLAAGIIDCNPETSRMIAADLLRHLEIEVYDFPLNDVLQNPKNIPPGIDLIFTTSTHIESLKSVLYPELDIIPLVLTPSSETVMELARIQRHQKVGFIALSQVFARIMRNSLQQYGQVNEPASVFFFGKTRDWDFVETFGIIDTIIIPENFELFSNRAEQELIADFTRKGGRIIKFNYSLDQGSKLYAENIIQEKTRIMQRVFEQTN